MKNQGTFHQPFILAVISGKGGVGKSMTSVNTAESLKRAGYRVALIDADLGLSNCATMMNETVEASVDEWIRGDCSLEELPQNCNGLTLITGSDEPARERFRPELYMDAMDQVILHLAADHDFIIIDTPAGIGEITLWALDRAHLGSILLVDEPTAISDVYRLCKYVYSIDPEYRFGGIVNLAESEKSAGSTHKRFNSILNYFLKKKTGYLGFIPESEMIRHAVKQQRTLFQDDPTSKLLDEFQFIAQNIIGYAGATKKDLAKVNL
ncbi:MAG: P-loop NTPase [Balneolaceae bacterium]